MFWPKGFFLKIDGARGWLLNFFWPEYRRCNRQFASGWQIERRFSLMSKSRWMGPTSRLRTGRSMNEKMSYFSRNNTINPLLKRCFDLLPRAGWFV